MLAGGGPQNYFGEVTLGTAGDATSPVSPNRVVHPTSSAPSSLQEASSTASSAAWAQAAGAVIGTGWRAKICSSTEQINLGLC